MFNSNPINNLF